MNKEKYISRKEFLKTSGLLSLAFFPNMNYGQKLSNKISQPNILIFITDHSAQKSIGAYGNKDVQTPNIDSIALNGIRFSNVYTPCPLCQPARAAFYTSRYPHETSVRSNEGRERIPNSMPTLGELFRAAGYDTYHAGKQHDAGSLKGFFKEGQGETIPPETTYSPIYNSDSFQDEYATEKVIEYIKKPHNVPFLALLNLNNPHNICNYAGYNKRTGSKANYPPLPENELPPLPENFEIDDLHTRPLPIQFLCCTHPRLWQGCEWNDLNYRRYLAAFYFFTKMADHHIGRVLETVRESGLIDNTLLIHMADHGDGMASHRMITKDVSFYEETTRVPFIFSGPGIAHKNVEITEPLISTLDLLPTLCAYANIEPPENIRGKSILPWLKGDNPGIHHTYIVSQWHKEYDLIKSNEDIYGLSKTATSPGRMLRTKKYKYIRYLESNGEEFYDMEKDPGEKKNLIFENNYATRLEEHRNLFQHYLQETNDDFMSLEVEVDPQYRFSHPLGYSHHFEKKLPKKSDNIELKIFPNPSKASINIEYFLPEEGELQIAIYDIVGRKIRLLPELTHHYGFNRISWNGQDEKGVKMSSGFYLCCLTYSKQTVIQKFYII